jgi:hydroxymethylpyrimidine pyrophosphatase-like HAD family hydrolase
MTDAHPTVRAAADRIAPSNDEDGVASVLSEIFGL